MKTPINPFLEDEEPTFEDTTTIVNPFLEDDEDTVVSQSPRPTAPQTPAPARPKQPRASTQPLSDDHRRDVKTASAIRQKTVKNAPATPRTAPQAATKPLSQQHQHDVKNTAAGAPRPAHPVKNTVSKPVETSPARLKIPNLGVEDDAPVKQETGSKQPYYFTKEYRENLTEEEKEVNRKRREALNKARGEAIKRGETPWEPGKRSTKRDWLYRARLTENDYFLFYYLAKFRYTTVRILARAMGVKEQTAYKRLRQFRDTHLYYFEDFGIKLWFPRQRAIAELEAAGYEVPKIKIKNPNKEGVALERISHDLALQWTIIAFMRGETTVQTERNFPKKLDWTQFITEHAMASDRFFIGGNDPLVKEKKNMVSKVLNGELTWAQFFDDRPAFWILPGSQLHRIPLKIPDAAINLEHMRKGDRPVSVALEIELSRKTADDYRQIFKQYSYDKSTYEALIYVVNNKSTGEYIKKIAAEEQFNRLIIEYLYDEDGNLLKRGSDLMILRDTKKK